VLIQIAVATLVSGSIAAFPGTSLSTLPAASYAVEAPAAAFDRERR